MKVHVPHLKLGHKTRRLVYVGNGATSVDSEYNKTESADCDRRFVSTTWSGFSYPKLQNPFVREDADCIGFYARRRTPAVWEWYCTDGSWHRTEADMPEKMLFPVGSSVKELYKDENSIYFVTQWEDKHGIRRNCGYEIFSKKLMAHAFGGMDGTTYHNTAEAFEHGKKEGYQSFEIDLSYTEDDRLVLCHGWTENNCKCTGVPYKPEFAHMTYEQAMQIPIHGHSIMDARQFYEKVKNEPAYTFEIDFHNKKKGNEKQVAAMLEDFRQDEGLLDRLLIQVYSQPMYEQIDSVYHFANYMYLVGSNIDKLDAILTYCLDHGICSVAMRTNFVTKENVRKVHDAGLYAFCYTVSADAVYANYLFQLGVDMICTDFVTEKALEATKETFGRYPFRVWYNSNHKEAISHY